MGADWKCDAIVGVNTCNLFNTRDGGLCSMHGAMPGVETLRSMLLKMKKAENDLARLLAEARAQAILDTSRKLPACGCVAATVARADVAAMIAAIGRPAVRDDTCPLCGRGDSR